MYIQLVHAVDGEGHPVYLLIRRPVGMRVIWCVCAASSHAARAAALVTGMCCEMAARWTRSAEALRFVRNGCQRWPLVLNVFLQPLSLCISLFLLGVGLSFSLALARLPQICEISSGIA